MDLNSAILQNEENIADIRGTYIPQSEKPELLNPSWIAPLQKQVKISGFDLDISIQDRRVSRMMIPVTCILLR